MLKLRNINHHNKIFQRVIISLILFYIPIIFKIFLHQNFKNEFVLMCSSLFVFLYEYIYSFFFFLKLKITKNQNHLKNYKFIVDKNPEFSEKFKEISIYASHKKFEFKTGEYCLNFIYFLLKFFFYFFWVYYFKIIGAKLDRSVEVTWGILFIPMYIISIPIMIYLILYYLSNRNKNKNKKIYRFLQAFVLIGIFLSFLTNMILIPLMADGTDFNFFVIPSISFFSTFLIFVNRYYLSN
jgi:hypothetical protein